MSRPTAFVVGRGVDLETAVAVKDLALRMGNAAVYKEGGITGEDCPNYLKLMDVDEVWRTGFDDEKNEASYFLLHASISLGRAVWCFSPRR